MERKIVRKQIFSAKDADGFGTAVSVEGALYMVITIITAASTDGTIYVYKSNAADEPASWTGQGKQSTYNEDSSAFIAGSTGLTLAASSVYHLTVNTDIARFLNLELSGNSAGSVDAFVTAAVEI